MEESERMLCEMRETHRRWRVRPDESRREERPERRDDDRRPERWEERRADRREEMRPEMRDGRRPAYTPGRQGRASRSLTDDAGVGLYFLYK